MLQGRFRLLFIAGLTAVLSQTIAAPAADRPSRRFVFGFTPSEDVAKTAETFFPLLDQVKARLRIEVDPRFFESYEELNDALREREVDLAWLGPLQFAQSYVAGQAVPLVAVQRRGGTNYRGQIVVRKDSPIRTLADLKGKTVGFVDAMSASGGLLPRILLEKNGLKWKSDFTPMFLGQHDNVLYLTLFNRVDAGAVFENAGEAYLSPSEQRKLRTLAFTEPCPSDVIVTRVGVNGVVAEKLRDAFLAAKPQKSGESGLTGFVALDMEGYQSLLDHFRRFKEKEAAR